MPSNHLILSQPLLLGLHSFLASGSFPMRHFFASGGQSTGVAASVSVFLVNSGLIPHVHGVEAAIAQEGLEQLLHDQGQECWQ